MLEKDTPLAQGEGDRQSLGAQEDEIEDFDKGHLFCFIGEWPAHETLSAISGGKAVVLAGAVFRSRSARDGEVGASAGWI